MPLVLGFDVYGTLVDPLGMERQLGTLFGDRGTAISASETNTCFQQGTELLRKLHFWNRTRERLRQALPGKIREEFSRAELDKSQFPTPWERVGL
jgi:hypothetical protein